jgi:hypothetical protein
MTAPAGTAVVDAVAIADALAGAEVVEDFFDDDDYTDLINEAADLLFDLVATQPTVVPTVVDALRRHTSLVREKDLRAACVFVEDRLSDIGAPTSLLHLKCARWIHEAVQTHGADAERVAALLSVRIHTDPDQVRSLAEVFTRPAPLIIDDELLALLGEATADDLNAAVDVLHRHADAANEVAAAAIELADLVGGDWTGPLGDAVAALEGDARVRAEELLAALPSVVRIGPS